MSWSAKTAIILSAILIFGIVATVEAGKIGGTSTLLRSKEDIEDELEKARGADPFKIIGRNLLKDLLRKMSSRIEVAGFISVRINRSLGEIVGPVSEVSVIQKNSEVYIRWRGQNRPALGQIYSLYTPGVVLQKRTDFTDFMVKENTYHAKKELDNYSLAGYLYESNGDIKILDISRGIVKARVVKAIKQISVGDQLMRALPRYSDIEPVATPIRMTAAIVAGSPHNNINVTQGSMLYLNRGKRDGIKVGTLFHTLEPIHLTDAPPIKKADGLGIAMVIYASDAYSTALILRQFNVIRIGSLMETMQVGPNRPSQFNLISVSGARRAKKAAIDPDLYLSELDKIERDSDILALSPEERKRLERLHLQELRRRNRSLPGGGESTALPNPRIDEGAAPQTPAASDLFRSSKKRRNNRARRLRKKQKEKKLSDEEELNQLFE